MKMQRLFSVCIVAVLLIAFGTTSAQEHKKKVEHAEHKTEHHHDMHAKENHAKEDHGSDRLGAARPGTMEPTQVVKPGTFQIEGGYEFVKSHNTDENVFGMSHLRYGLVKNIEIGFSAGSYISESDGSHDLSGLSDMSINVRAHIKDGAHHFDFFNPDMALFVETSLPTGKEGLGSDKMQPVLAVSSHWHVNDIFAFGLLLKNEFIREDETAAPDPHYTGHKISSKVSDYSAAAPHAESADDHHTTVTGNHSDFTAALALDFTLNHNTGCFIELIRVFRDSKYGENENHLEGGIMFYPNNDLQLDLYGGSVIDGEHTHYFFSAGIAYRLFKRH